ncbi:hypothetical protein CKG00_11425 [Morganella morganii]|uniref:Uncharacterized protein n=1 Tax=Morganella morganii TaxID=582 RepID=A0A433ZXU1_MORMO|nr:hypothetical protein CKG00_11425 [Morganella morganii]
MRVSALGKSNAAKAAGSGKLLFWCVISNNLNYKKYILEMKKGESWAMGVDDIPIGSVVPFPGSSTKTIKLSKFKW